MLKMQIVKRICIVCSCILQCVVPATQSAILQAVTEAVPSYGWAIDPFMGSGTSLMSCMEFGINVYGQDINPLAVLLAKSKTCSAFHYPRYFIA